MKHGRRLPCWLRLVQLATLLASTYPATLSRVGNHQRDIMLLTQHIPSGYTRSTRLGMAIFNEITQSKANILMLQTDSLMANDVVQKMNCNLYRYGGLLSCIRKDVYKISTSFVVSPIYNGFHIGVGIVQAGFMENDDQVLVFGNLMLNQPPTSLKIQDGTFIESFSSQVENIGKGKHFSAKTKNLSLAFTKTKQIQWYLKDMKAYVLMIRK